MIMEAKKTVWSIFRDYVNSKPIGTEITRQEIIEHIETFGLYCFNDTSSMKRLKLVDNKAPLYSHHTLDSTRNMATGRYYLEKTERAGHYKIICHFPSDYTVSQLRKDYDCEQKMIAERNEHGSRNNSNKD